MFEGVAESTPSRKYVVRFSRDLPHAWSNARQSRGSSPHA
ncbi:hypothetical protein AKJ09_04382 [Labilithrix luteola]|uniref:Uncharacterized protein n=1 Tax=Labilithrix luteola TaxID=1391654 RepID=A0A0K1PW26_9BACT|nr:hypothetical protein AKJ09_04382 [Labilithrix luteola]